MLNAFLAAALREWRKNGMIDRVEESLKLGHQKALACF